MVAFPRLTRDGQRVVFHVEMPLGLREAVQRLAEESGHSYTQLGSFLLQEAVAQRREGGGTLRDALEVPWERPKGGPVQHTSLSVAPHGARAMRLLLDDLQRTSTAVIVALFERAHENFAPSAEPQVRDLTVPGLQRLFDACTSASRPDVARTGWTEVVSDVEPAIGRPRRTGKRFYVVFPPSSFQRLEDLTEWTGLTATQVVTVGVRAAADALRAQPRGSAGAPRRLIRKWGEFRCYRKTSVYLSEATVRDMTLLEDDAGRSHHHVLSGVIDHAHFCFGAPPVQRAGGPGDIVPEGLRRLAVGLSYPAPRSRGMEGDGVQSLPAR